MEIIRFSFIIMFVLSTLLPITEKENEVSDELTEAENTEETTEEGSIENETTEQKETDESVEEPSAEPELESVEEQTKDEQSAETTEEVTEEVTTEVEDITEEPVPKEEESTEEQPAEENVEQQEPTETVTLTLPKNITFPTMTISHEVIQVEAIVENETQIEVEVGTELSDWTLTVEAEPFMSPDGHVLESTIFFKDITGELHSLSNEAYKVADSKSIIQDDYDNISIGTDEESGFVLELNPLFAKSETTYTSTLKWTITEGP